MARQLTAALLIPTLLIAAGCGGGSPTASQGAGARFLPEPAVGGNAILLTAPLVGRSLLLLELQVVEVENLHFASFDLTYPAGILALNGASEGGHLSASGQDPVRFTTSGSEGVVRVDIRRLGQPAGRSGSGRLATIGFQIIGQGSGDLVFTHSRATDPNNAEIPGLVWLGGTIVNEF